jgi:RNA polymerase sigma factor (sigma-70 family)
MDQAQPASFATTHWSLVLAARDRAAPGAREALESLITAYWYPLYAFVRHKGRDADESLDLVQGFFTRLLEKQDLKAIDPSRGRFRSFLMAACTNYLANEHDRERAQKRGGKPPLSLDALAADQRYRHEPAHSLTPERLFLRRWTTTLLDRVLDRLACEMKESGKAHVFEVLKPTLLGEDDSASYRELGSRAGLSEGAARVAAHRLRARYREILRDEVAQTVADPAEVDEELRDLFASISG